MKFARSAVQSSLSLSLDGRYHGGDIILPIPIAAAFNCVMHSTSIWFRIRKMNKVEYHQEKKPSWHFTTINGNKSRTPLGCGGSKFENWWTWLNYMELHTRIIVKKHRKVNFVIFHSRFMSSNFSPRAYVRVRRVENLMT